ncbi:MAG: thiamine phosphate synthase [Polyangiaceae bacterium]|jgi:thiamine-phosphate diphosphorylase
MKPPRLILISDPAFLDELVVRCMRAVAHALPPGTFGVQLRDKQRPPAALRVAASFFRVATRAAGVPLFVNGALEVARDSGADGVHLGGGAGSVRQARELLGRKTWVSVAAHTDDDVVRAKNDGADAVLVSPIFATRSHGAAGYRKVPRGVDAIRSAREHAGTAMSVYALGGVTFGSAQACAEAGADGVALIRALLTSTEPGRAARAVHDAFLGR